jgi:hypothetical protein
MFTTAHHWAYPEPVQSSPHPHILFLYNPFSSHLHLIQSTNVKNTVSCVLSQNCYISKRVKEGVDDEEKNYSKPTVPNHQCSLYYLHEWAILNYHRSAV